VHIEAQSYLLSLAALAVSFVGFSSLVITLRQTAGGSMSELDAFLTRTFVQLGFIVAGGALFPELLLLGNLPAPIVWRVASGVVAVPALLLALTYPYRRRQASGRKTPLVIWVDVLVLTAVGTTLAVYATGATDLPGPILVATSLTFILFLSGSAYLQALQLLLKEHVGRAN
jgi:hypothetical protein